MPRKKGYSASKYQKEIVLTLREEPFMSTAEISKKMNMGYETGLKYLKSLNEKELVRLKRVGNRRFWYTGK
jgi:Mn-dependent DtxR family transcriptional regulator